MNTARKYLGAPLEMYPWYRIWLIFSRKAKNGEAAVEQNPVIRFWLMKFQTREKDEQMRNKASVSVTDLARENEKISWFSFFLLSLGNIAGRGMLSKMPDMYASFGPSIVISYFINFAIAIAQCLVYSELSVLFPMVGGAFIYTLNIFGEFPAVLCGTSMVVAYISSISAVARNLSTFFPQLVDCDVSILQVEVKAVQNAPLDWLGFVALISLTLLLCWSTKVFDRGNIVVQTLHLVLFLFMIIAAFVYANSKNWAPFFPKIHCPTQEYSNSHEETARIFMAITSNLYYCFIGFEVVAQGAEEAKGRRTGQMPGIALGMLSGLGLTGAIYIPLVVGMIFLINPQTLRNYYVWGSEKSSNLPCPPPGFSKDKGWMLAFKSQNLKWPPGYSHYEGWMLAFQSRGLKWMHYITAATALVSIISHMCISLWGGARIIQALAREGMLPAFLGKVEKKTYTPVIATLTIGIVCALLTLFTTFNTLSTMSVAFFLIVFWFVGVTHLYIRYAPLSDLPEEDKRAELRVGRTDDLHTNAEAKRWLLMACICLLTISGLGFAWYWNARPHSYSWLVVCTATWFLVTLLIRLSLPITFIPREFAVSSWAMPWLPSFVIFSSTLILGMSVNCKANFQRVAVAMGAGTLLYFLFGVNTTYYRFRVAHEEENIIDEM